MNDYEHEGLEKPEALTPANTSAPNYHLVSLFYCWSLKNSCRPTEHCGQEILVLS